MSVIEIPTGTNSPPTPVVVLGPSSAVYTNAKPAAIDSTTPAPSSHSLVTSPFADVIGECFLLLCLFVEFCIVWSGKIQRLVEGMTRAATSGLRRWFSANRIWAWFGIAACVAVTSALIPVLFRMSVAFPSLLPLLFLLTIFCVALRFGNRAGILATIAAALLLEFLIYKPVLGLVVNNSVAGEYTVSIMLLLGICSSVLFGRRKAVAVYKPWKLQ